MWIKDFTSKSPYWRFSNSFLLLDAPSFPHQEAAELSSLKAQLQDLEVPLFAVVKENLGKELDCFKKFFSGKVYVDQKVCSCKMHPLHMALRVT